jgi:hypothetical protein
LHFFENDSAIALIGDNKIYRYSLETNQVGKIYNIDDFFLQTNKEEYINKGESLFNYDFIVIERQDKLYLFCWSRFDLGEIIIFDMANKSKNIFSLQIPIQKDKIKYDTSKDRIVAINDSCLYYWNFSKLENGNIVPDTVIYCDEKLYTLQVKGGYLYIAEGLNKFHYFSNYSFYYYNRLKSEVYPTIVDLFYADKYFLSILKSPYMLIKVIVLHPILSVSLNFMLLWTI